MPTENTAPMALDEAICLLCRVHLRAIEFDDWHVVIGAIPETSWDAQDYPRAWEALREHVMKGRQR